jgi:hypothetical protein
MLFDPNQDKKIVIRNDFLEEKVISDVFLDLSFSTCQEGA